MTSLVEVRDLIKVYGGTKRAVDGLSFDVGSGEIFGFLGPNGSGKTTTIRVLVTLLAKTSGVVTVGGFDIERDPAKVRGIIGYAAQSIGVDNDLTAGENLVLQGRLHRLGRREASRRSAELLERFGLGTVSGQRAGRLSGGTRRRLDLAQALMHRPQLLFLDEPTTGLDPQSRNALWAYLEELRGTGTTIFLTTQHLEEADLACDRVAIIDKGHLARIGIPAALKKEVGAERIVLTLVESGAGHTYERAAKVARACPGVSGLVQTEPLILSVTDAGRCLPGVIRRLDEEGIEIATLRHLQVSLDDVFLHLTGHAVHAETGGEGAPSSLFASLHGGKH
ncbi:MAG: ATP-binding cassette domain-containing protein [Acidimicrobiales bacterium]